MQIPPLTRLLPLRLIALLWLNQDPSLHAHIGNPNAVFEGTAGPYPIRAIIQTPPVVPGLARINVRILSGTPDSVEVLPIHWRTGRNGAPNPDRAVRVPGDSNLFTAELWLMVQGAYSVDILVNGTAGKGAIKVPVNSLATTAIEMPRALGWILAILGSGLMVLLIGTVRAAAREAMLPAGEPLSSQRRQAGRLATISACIVTVGLVYAGQYWWNLEDRTHRARELYKPIPNRVSILDDAQGARIRLELDADPVVQVIPLVPDHGRLMHLFLIQNSVQKSLAHLHPQPNESKSVFECQFPPLPPGRYRVFADITRETGLSETITNTLEIYQSRNPNQRVHLTDSDDSWHILGSVPNSTHAELLDGWTARITTTTPIVANDPVALEVRINGPDGRPAPLQGYMGMLGHAVIVSADGTVFSHVHPAGTVSMAAQRQFLSRDGENVDKALADANCGDLTVLPISVAEALGRGGLVRFPYAFPTAGTYTLWVQVKISGRIQTACFALRVLPGKDRTWNPYQ